MIIEARNTDKGGDKEGKGFTTLSKKPIVFAGLLVLFIVCTIVVTATILIIWGRDKNKRGGNSGRDGSSMGMLIYYEIKSNYLKAYIM